MGWAAMRERTSLNQVKGLTSVRWQEATKLRSTAAVWPPWSLPKNVQLFRLTATPRIARSVALLSISRSPNRRLAARGGLEGGRQRHQVVGHGPGVLRTECLADRRVAPGRYSVRHGAQGK